MPAGLSPSRLTPPALIGFLLLDAHQVSSNERMSGGQLEENCRPSLWDGSEVFLQPPLLPWMVGFAARQPLQDPPLGNARLCFHCQAAHMGEGGPQGSQAHLVFTLNKSASGTPMLGGSLCCRIGSLVFGDVAVTWHPPILHRDTPLPQFSCLRINPVTQLLTRSGGV
jgi:hypothetical protein